MNPATADGVALSDTTVAEGFAHVVAIEGRMIWLEPEQSSGCGSCAASSSCASKGIGTLASRLEARRFPLENPANLEVGDKVVVGIQHDALVQGSFIAYGIPLAAMWLAAAVAQSSAGNDIVTMAAMAAGLVFGLGLARFGATRLATRGDLAPRFLRRANHGADCLPLHNRSGK
jgi:sigma-E factor negative regulatory protein RseC